MQLIKEIVITEAKLVISDYNLQKFYTLSKKIIINEQDSQS